MRSKFVLTMFAVAFGTGMLTAADPPQWAYGTVPAPAAGAGGGGRGAQAPPDTSLKHLRGSTLEFTRAQINDAFGPADWYPGDHPTMPDIVAHGRRPDIRACALCHYPNGKGRSENASVSGLPVSYFIQQMMDFREGNRKSSDPRKANTIAMGTMAKAMTDDEIKAAAEYYGSMKWTPYVRVVETTTVPKTRIANGMFLALEGTEMEPLGQRIIEVPEDTEATENRDGRSGFIAYAPVGSLKKGEALAAQCGTCHGAELRGLGPVPGIAGRTASYLMRQMFDMQQGMRKGLWSDLMKPVLANKSEADLMNLAAYVASRTP